jgi:hypothetical protein
MSGHPRRLLSRADGAGRYRRRGADVAEKGYEGFEMQ